MLGWMEPSDLHVLKQKSRKVLRQLAIRIGIRMGSGSATKRKDQLIAEIMDRRSGISGLCFF